MAAGGCEFTHPAVPPRGLFWQPFYISSTIGICFKNLEPKEGIRQLVEQLITKLDRKSKGISPDPVFLRFAMEEIQPRFRKRSSMRRLFAPLRSSLRI